ncbi:permease [Treponema vincentii]|uniref:AEC family transporter n=1 Tax=Treponema vincentii TaxID=69710 RepID=UPI0020A3F964|nr:permease [Treponema vincentii]UTC46991.1 permease [Treponema vincentii]
MALKILLPFLYLGLGFLLGKTPIDIKNQTSYLLTRLAIPMVIIYNIATFHSDLFFIITAMIVMLTAMMLLSRLFTSDAVERLCFFYLNIGWLALPVVTAVWGDSAAMAILSLYIGNSLFGNSIGAGMLINNGAVKIDIKRTLQSPPVAALIIGVACIPFGDVFRHYLPPVYRMVKWLLTFLGMGVLGMWLAHIKLCRKDFKAALRWALLRAVVVGFFLTLFIYIAGMFKLKLVTANKSALYIICIMPPAANIIVLETHYCHTGKSAGLTAWGTLLSLALIVIYIGVTKLVF